MGDYIGGANKLVYKARLWTIDWAMKTEPKHLKCWKEDHVELSFTVLLSNPDEK